MAKKQRLSELLAIEPDLKGKFSIRVNDKVITLSGKPEQFLGMLRTLKMVDSERENEEAAGEVRKEIDTTVDAEIVQAWEAIGPYFDALLSKEKTNQVATADLIVGDEVLAKDLPATFLLGLEERLKTVRMIYEAVPTHQPGISWKLDPDKGRGIFKAEFPERNQKTEKDFQFRELAKATD